MIEFAIRFFTDAGWLANALGIVVPLGAGSLFIFKVALPFLNRSKINSVIPKSLVHSWKAEDTKALARIAIVDDQPQDFPIADLKRDHFNIQTYKQVQLVDIVQLATYDIVFLDMKGIVKDDPEYGGLKLIAELRKQNPMQKICAVSSKTFDPTATEFFRQANDYKKKPLTAQECKQVIDSFLAEILDARVVVHTATAVVEKLPIRKRIEIVRLVNNFLRNRQDAHSFDQALGRLGLEKVERFPIVNLSRMIVHAVK